MFSQQCHSNTTKHSMTPTLTLPSLLALQALSATLSAPLCPTIRHAYSTLLRVSQMEVQLFDSLFRAPDSDTKNHDAAAVGEGSSIPVKKPAVSAEVVSIIESVCNATGQCHVPLLL